MTDRNMGLVIHRRSWTKADGSVTTAWRLVVEDYSGEKRVTTYPEKRHYVRYGLDPDDSYERAFEKLQVIRAKQKIVREAELRARVETRLKKLDRAEHAFLPAGLYAEFQDWLKERRVWDDIPLKTQSHLRALRKMVIDLNVEPSTWSKEPQRVYGWFRKEAYAPSSVQKILPLINDYGYFYCRELQKPFLAIPAPRGDVRRRIEDANLDSRDGKTNESLPLTPLLIMKLQDLPDDQFRWMRTSFYFGLRPIEVDGLTKASEDKTWKVTVDSKGTPILHVYQTKLVAVERKRRWKRIPAILPDQRNLLSEIARGLPMTRPYPKVIQARLGEGFGLYAGRKGFEKMMKEHGQDFRHVSRYLGHQDVNRTERNYRDHEAVDYTMPEPTALRVLQIRERPKLRRRFPRLEVART